MSLKHSYRLLAPVYDPLVASASEAMRSKSLARLGDVTGQRILLPGIGTGLDLPHLPVGADYVGVDLTPAMLARARQRVPAQLRIHLQQGDAMALPFEDAGFDAVIMHLILAVVPEPGRALQEAARVVRPGGRIYILDKFLRPGQRAPLRRLLNILLRHIATRTDVVFEHLLDTCPSLRLIQDEPAVPGGWFRHIELERQPRTG